MLLPTVVLLLALDQRTLVDPQNVNQPCEAKQSSVHRVELFLHKALPCSYAIDRRGESSLNSRAKSRTLRSMVKSSRIFGATMSVNAAGSEYSTRELTIYVRRLRSWSGGLHRYKVTALALARQHCRSRSSRYHYLKLGPAVWCRSSPEFPFRFIWVLGWSTWCLCANDRDTEFIRLCHFV